MDGLKTFRFWCYKVLPLVYDDSLSYYEVLCKVVDYINKLIEQDKIFGNELDKINEDMIEVREWIDKHDTSFIKDLVEKYLTEAIKTVQFGISTGGYFMASIPEAWSDIKFGTVQDEPLYGHLVLSYD